MTAASIINYKVPSTPQTYKSVTGYLSPSEHRTPTGQRPPTTHSKLSVLKNVEVQPSRFKSMIERQKTQMFPMRMKSINTSSMNHYDHLNSANQTVNHKRFIATPFRRASPTEKPIEKGLPRTHILTAKTLHKAQCKESKETIQERETISPVKKPWSAEKIDATSAEKHNRYKQAMHKIVLSYGCKSLVPFCDTDNGTSNSVSVDHQYSKAELVDYSTVVAMTYQR